LRISLNRVFEYIEPFQYYKGYNVKASRKTLPYEQRSFLSLLVYYDLLFADIKDEEKK
jgi:hypothetical protein